MKIRTLLIALAALTACNSSKKTTKKYTELEPLAVKAKPLPPQKYQATAERVWDILHTEISLTFDWLTRTATGLTVLKITPLKDAQDTLVLDAKGLKVRRIIDPGIGLPESNDIRFRQMGDSLIIYRNRRWSGRDTLRFVIQYTAYPYAQDAKGSAAIREARGLYFINTNYAQSKLPAQIWTQGETEANSHWFPTIDKPNERFTTDISITVPDSFTTLSNGVLVSSRKDGLLRTDHWKMDKPIQPYAVMMAIGKYSIVEDEKWRGIPVNYYVEPQYAPTAKQMFKHTPEMMEFFSRITGVPYPWPKYSQVVVRDFVSGAMENTSASTFGEFMNRNSRELLDGSGEDVVSHELFHQWFGDYATAESWANLTVNESFATYGEVLWRRHKYGDDAADELRYNDLQRYLASTERADPPLVRFYYRDKEEMFDRVSYQKGGAILHYMHRLMGDSAFSRAMKIYLIDNALQPAEAHDWRKAVEEATGQDWNPFFNQWYFRGGHPVVEVTHHYDDAAGKLRVAFLQTGKDSAFTYNLPMQMATIHAGGSKSVIQWTMARRRDTFTVDYFSPNRRPIVIADAGHWIVGEVIHKRPDTLFKQWAMIFDEQPDFVTRRSVLNTIRGKESTPTGRAVLASALATKYPPIRTQAAQMLATAKDSSIRPQFAETLIRIARTDTSTHTRAAAISALTAWRDVRVMQIAAVAVNDSSYLVAGTALTAIDKLEEGGKKGQSAYAEARRLLPTARRGDLWSAALTVIGEYGRAEDTAVFQKEIERVEPAQYAGALSRWATLASRTQSRGAFSSYLTTIDALLPAQPDADDRGSYALTLYQLTGRLRTPGEPTKALGEAEISARMEAARSLIFAITERETDKKIQDFLRNTYRTNFPSAAKK